MDILFLDFTRKRTSRVFDYDNAESLRGGERGLLNLAESLAKRGHKVAIAAATSANAKVQRGVSFTNIKSAREARFDVAISNNYAFAFDGVTAPVKIVWTRNPGFSWSHVKADFVAKLRYRPKLVHLSKYTRDRSWFLPRSGDTIIHHGIAANLLQQRAERAKAPPPIALFASYASRNLAMVVRAWCRVVAPAVPGAELLVAAEITNPKHIDFLSREDLEQSNIQLVGTQPWSTLMQQMKAARVLLVPGHFQETFNNLCVEGAVAGLPVVTMGIGALKERVLHDRTGWIATSEQDMGQAIVRLLTDDGLWLRHHKECLRHPDLISWDDRAGTWERYMLEQLHRTQNVTEPLPVVKFNS